MGPLTLRSAGVLASALQQVSVAAACGGGAGGSGAPGAGHAAAQLPGLVLRVRALLRSWLQVGAG